MHFKIKQTLLCDACRLDSADGGPTLEQWKITTTILRQTKVFRTSIKLTG